MRTALDSAQPHVKIRSISATFLWPKSLGEWRDPNLVKNGRLRVDFHIAHKTQLSVTFVTMLAPGGSLMEAKGASGAPL